MCLTRELRDALLRDVLGCDALGKSKELVEETA